MNSIQKEREAFEDWYIRNMDTNGDFEKISEQDSPYMDEHVNNSWLTWQAAKAQAVPDTYTPIVLALEDVQSKIAQASFLTMDADNENEVYAVDANELHEYIAELIEAQEPAK